MAGKGKGILANWDSTGEGVRQAMDLCDHRSASDLSVERQRGCFLESRARPDRHRTSR